MHRRSLTIYDYSTVQNTKMQTQIKNLPKIKFKSNFGQKEEPSFDYYGEV